MNLRKLKPTFILMLVTSVTPAFGAVVLFLILLNYITILKRNIRMFRKFVIMRGYLLVIVRKWNIFDF